MRIRNIACTSLLFLAVSALAAESVLPQNMEGKWGRNQNKAEVELIQMETPTKAKLKVVFWDGCTRQGETTAELKDGTWTFVAPGGMRCEDISVTMTQLPGKNRFEGATESIWRGAVVKADFYLEGK